MVLTRQYIKEKALELGFSFCGFAEAGPLGEDWSFFSNYLREKKNAGLHYLEREPEKRLDPRQVFPGTKTVIALLLNYFPGEPVADEDNFIISKYAYGKDYHVLVKEKANALIACMKEADEPVAAKAYVDGAPVLEKAWARHCGIGWTGKNTLLINPARGSFHFIAIILTDREFQPDAAETDHCGTCRKCMDACPTGALVNPFELDPSRCISYLTIEEKAAVPENLRDKLNGRIFGCDICQDCCPFNRFAIPHTEPAFNPSEKLRSFRKKDWLALTQEEFGIMFKGTAIWRTGYQKLRINIRNASGTNEV